MRAAGQPSPNHRADRNNVLVPVGTFEIRRGCGNFDIISDCVSCLF